MVSLEELQRVSELLIDPESMPQVIEVCASFPEILEDPYLPECVTDTIYRQYRAKVASGETIERIPRDRQLDMCRLVSEDKLSLLRYKVSLNL